MRHCYIPWILIFLLQLSYNFGFGQISQNIDLLYQYDNPNISGYNDIWGYADNGKEIAILGARDSILFFDVSDPAQVIKLPGIEPGKISTWRDFKTYKNFCYGVTEASEGLTIINMDSIQAGKTTYRIDSSQFVSAHNLFIDTAQSKLYLCGTDVNSGAWDGLIIFDLEPDPYHPVHLASFNFSSFGINCDGSSDTYVHDLHVRNDTAYCNMESDCGYYVFDVSSPSNPVYLGDIAPSGFQNGYNHSTWINQNSSLSAVAEETHGRPLYFVDISDLSSLQVIGTYKDPLIQSENDNIAHNPFIKGDLCYVSYYHDGVIILDISNPSNPIRVGYYDTEPNNTNYDGFEGAWGVYPYLPSGNLLASDMNNGLFVLEVNESILAVDWLRFQIFNERNHTFDLEAILQSTQPLERAEMYWSASGDNFSLLTPLEAKKEKHNQYKISQTLDRPSSKTFYVQIRTTEVDGYRSKSVVRRVGPAENASFSVFPNPAISEIYIEHSDASRLLIYNMNGKLVQDNQLSAGINEIPLQNHIISGTYTLVLKALDNTILDRKKLLVNP